ISYYTWGLDLSGTLQGAGGVGGLLSDTKVSSSETNTYFAVGDANGNITEYVDTTGVTKAHYEYNSAGEVTYQSGAMADDFTHRFSTKPFDSETGFVVYQGRYYDPILCKWLSRDPITEDGGKNLYLLGNNNAINKWDYLGKSKTSDINIDFSPMIKWKYEVQYMWGVAFSAQLKVVSQKLPGKAPYRRKLINNSTTTKDWCLWKSRKLTIWAEPVNGFSSVYQNDGYFLRYEPLIAFSLDGNDTEGKWKRTWRKAGAINWSGLTVTATGQQKTFVDYIWGTAKRQLKLHVHRKIIKHNVMSAEGSEQSLPILEFNLTESIGDKP
ncbi:MAG: RHS repeat-associated core domain-containing protein, partial [Candidatus Cloacimonetes bacterium]|nr:RHS repeat-associated core domain-containing protein [Candidatus Cloacimonadota bacterium]